MTIHIPALLIYILVVLGLIPVVGFAIWLFWIYGGTKGWWECVK